MPQPWIGARLASCWFDGETVVLFLFNCDEASNVIPENNKRLELRLTEDLVDGTVTFSVHHGA